MSSPTGSGSSSRIGIAIAAAIVAIVFIVAGLIYVAVPASSLPGFMGHVAGSTGHHPLRAAGCLIVGVVFAVLAWFALKYKGKAVEPAGSSAKEPAAH